MAPSRCDPCRKGVLHTACSPFCRYPALEVHPVVVALDQIVLGVFIIEILVKIAAEGAAPWRYWTGKEFKWNNFDFVIVVLCLPIGLEGGSAVSRALSRG